MLLVFKNISWRCFFAPLVQRENCFCPEGRKCLDHVGTRRSSVCLVPTAAHGDKFYVEPKYFCKYHSYKIVIYVCKVFQIIVSLSVILIIRGYDALHESLHVRLYNKTVIGFV
jgi:hypothetical protein